MVQWVGIPCQYRGPRFDPWIGKIPWRRKWQHAPAVLPGKSHGQRTLGRYSPRGCKRVKHDVVTKQQKQLQINWYNAKNFTDAQLIFVDKTTKHPCFPQIFAPLSLSGFWSASQNIFSEYKEAHCEVFWNWELVNLFFFFTSIDFLEQLLKKSIDSLFHLKILLWQNIYHVKFTTLTIFKCTIW